MQCNSASVMSVVPPDAQPLTFERTPGLGDPFLNPLGGIASADEMRDILDVLNADDSSDAAGKRPVSAAEEAAEKRRKHREAMVLFRLRKKMNFGDMKKQEQTLQDVLQLKLQQYRQLRVRRAATKQDKHEEATMVALQDEFADVLTVKEALLRENRAMESVINELAKFQKLVQDEVDRQAEEERSPSAASSPRDPPSMLARGGEWIQFLENEPPFYYVPERVEGNQLARESFQEIMDLDRDFVNKTVVITETYCLGWKAQHSFVRTADNKHVLRFRFVRQVPRWFMSLEDYRRLAWPVVTTPSLNARLYSSPVHMKVVQWIDDNTFITLRNSPHRDRGIHLRYFASNTQVEYRDELNRRTYMIHHSIIDKEPHVQATGENPVIWIKKGGQAMSFTEIPENDAIEIINYGYMNCISEDQARYLMIETCSILMRWEQMVVPPRMLTVD